MVLPNKATSTMVKCTWQLGNIPNESNCHKHEHITPIVPQGCTLCHQAVQTEKHLIFDKHLKCASCALPAVTCFIPEHTSSHKAFLKNHQSPQRVVNFTRSFCQLWKKWAYINSQIAPVYGPAQCVFWCQVCTAAVTFNGVFSKGTCGQIHNLKLFPFSLYMFCSFLGYCPLGWEPL
jgi:hypothetical protein